MAEISILKGVKAWEFSLFTPVSIYFSITFLAFESTILFNKVSTSSQPLRATLNLTYASVTNILRNFKNVYKNLVLKPSFWKQVRQI